MRILDPFCGAGGAATGYHRAGFEVTGIDIVPQPRYPFEFIQADAMEVLEELASSGCWLLPPDQRWQRRCLDVSEFDAIHASPPCQGYSKASRCRPGLADKYPKLIEPLRELLKQTGLPYVIENVEGAPLENPVKLCGTMFGLGAEFKGQWLVLRRHRLFEANFPVPQPKCNHKGYSLTVASHGHPNNDRVRTIPVFGCGAPGNRPDLRGPGFAQAAREAMGIDWMRREELDESIPPAFTEYVGSFIHSNRAVTSIAA